MEYRGRFVNFVVANREHLDAETSADRLNRLENELKVRIIGRTILHGFPAKPGEQNVHQIWQLELAEAVNLEQARTILDGTTSDERAGNSAVTTVDVALPDEP